MTRNVHALRQSISFTSLSRTQQQWPLVKLLTQMLLCFNLSMSCTPLQRVCNRTRCGLGCLCQLLDLGWGSPLQGEPARKRRRTKSDAGPRDRDEEGAGIQGGEAAASILRGELELAPLSDFQATRFCLQGYKGTRLHSTRLALLATANYAVARHLQPAVLDLWMTGRVCMADSHTCMYCFQQCAGTWLG